MSYEIWKFETARFTVLVTAEEETDLDLSFDKTGEVLEQLNSGALQAFRVKVSVLLDGYREVGTDHLGGCIYANPGDFRDHIGIGERAYLEQARRDVCETFEWTLQRLIRNRRKYQRGTRSRAYHARSNAEYLETLAKARKDFAQRKAAAGKIGSYFSDMVREACRDAREALSNTPNMRAA